MPLCNCVPCCTTTAHSQFRAGACLIFPPGAWASSHRDLLYRDMVLAVMSTLGLWLVRPDTRLSFWKEATARGSKAFKDIYSLVVTIPVSIAFNRPTNSYGPLSCIQEDMCLISYASSRIAICNWWIYECLDIEQLMRQLIHQNYSVLES